ncbi:MAG TPA: carbohydrate ABC transporter permease [Armatimonadota bacterium]|jgi:multiple sugar transport system permease protein
MALPLLWMIATSLKSPGAVFTYPPEFIPREQETWTDPSSGATLPLYTATVEGRAQTVALVRSLPGQVEVALVAGTPPGRRVLLAGSAAELQPLKRTVLHGDNYPAAWNSMRLSHGWLGFNFDYRLRVSLAGQSWQVGPWKWDGLPLYNAFLVFYLNSLLISIAVTLGTLLTSALAAFAFARLEFPGRNALFLTYLSTLMVPFVVTMIPIFALLKALHLIDTYFALIVPVMFSAYGTFLLRQFFLSIPHDLEDAARLDGCGHLGVLRHVVLPLSKPALATLGTFTFLGAWNSFMWPLIVINSEEKMPLMLGLNTFMGAYTAQWHLLMAASVMVMIPVVLVFVVGQKYFIEGIVMSGMKG